MRHRFVNELGSVIDMTVEATKDQCLVTADGPDSKVEHAWTRREAEHLRDMLEVVLRDAK